MPETDNPLLTAALAYAARGWHVFPCAAGLKVPAEGTNGWQSATTDPDRIAAWWAENPRYNVAIATGPSALAVLDVDPKGLEHWERIASEDPELAAAVEASPKVTTPRGGFHAYMAGDIRSTASHMAPGIDTRGAGGYVLAPPSFVSDDKARGPYIGDPLAHVLGQVPAGMMARLAPKEVERKEAPLPPSEVQWDNPEAVSKARGMLEAKVRAGDVAIEGEGGDQKTYEVVCSILEMAITPTMTLELLGKVWNPHCQPPWDTAALETKIHNAWRYGQDTKGGKAERPMAEEHAHLIPEVKEGRERAAEIRQQLGRFAPALWLDGWRDVPDYEWLVDKVFPKEGVGVLYGPPGTMKTFLALDLALAIATGYGPNWWKGFREPQPVVYMAGESPKAFRKKRMGAWVASNPLPGLEQRGMKNFWGIPGVPSFTMDGFWSLFGELMHVEGVKPGLIVIDTLQRAMVGLNENHVQDMVSAIARLEKLAREFDCFILVLHHVSKGPGDRTTMRGSSSLEASVDTLFELSTPERGSKIVKMHFRRNKEADIDVPPYLFHGAVHGESLAFVRDWNPPSEKAPIRAGKGSEEWLTDLALANALGGNTLTTDHLATSLSQAYGVPIKVAKKGLRDARVFKQAWVAGDDLWKIPEGINTTKFNPEEF